MSVKGYFLSESLKRNEPFAILSPGFNINYECSKMSFLSTFTCHFGHHIPSNSNNECSLGSGEGGHLAGEGQTT